MKKFIEFKFPDFKSKITAILLEEEEPELCEILWKNIEEPLKMICRHPLSEGYNWYAEGRPPRHPVKTGLQSQPVGKDPAIVCKLKLGEITYAIFGGYGAICVNYGPATEPLPVGGSIVANVIEEDIDELLETSKLIWNAQYRTHLPVIIYMKRKEE